MAVHNYGFCDKCLYWHDMDSACIQKEIEDLRARGRELEAKLAATWVDLFMLIASLVIKFFGFWMVWHFSHSWLAMLGALLIDVRYNRKSK